LDLLVLELNHFSFVLSVRKLKNTNEIENEYIVMVWKNDNKIKNKEKVTISIWLI